EPRVHHGATGPGVTLVDGISMSVHLERAIEMRALLDGSLAVVFHLAAPEQDVIFIIGRLQLQPGVISVNRAAWEEVAHLPRAYDDFNHDGLAAANRWRNSVEGSTDGQGLSIGFCGVDFSFFTYGKCRRQLRGRQLGSGLRALGRRRRDSEDIHRYAVFQ